MKRRMQDYVGRPVANSPRPEVMGRPPIGRPADVASFLDASRDASGSEGSARAATGSDAKNVDEFAEFLSGNVDPGAPFLCEPGDVDPVFKERLRRRLFRLHLLAQPQPSNDPH